MWYSHLRGFRGGRWKLYEAVAGEYRCVNLERNIKNLFRLAGLPPQSPHEFRHGYAVYCLHKARNLGDLKAISMNMMHSSIRVTDEIYGVFASDDVKSTLDKLSGANKSSTRDELIANLRALLADLEDETDSN